MYLNLLIYTQNADGPDYTFNVSIDGGSNYNVAKTSTNFNARQSEGDGHRFSLYNW